jgi:aminoglycoside phosphotransferase (APT) family kinase protein
LQPADHAIAARDPWLPHLPVVLDDEELTAYLRRTWHAGSQPPDAARVTYLRYKPRTQVVAAVELSTDDRTTTALLAATSDRTRTKRAKLVAHAARRGIAPLAGDGGRGPLVMPIGADRHLPACDRLPTYLRRLDRDLRGADLDVLAYKPHRRLVLRVDVEGEPRAVLKVHRPAAIADIAATLRWAAERGSDRLPLPELVGIDARHGIAVTAWVPGGALHEQEPDRRRATLRAIGKVLGRLHRRDAAGLPPRDLDRDVGAPAAIRWLRPELQAIVESTLAAARPGSGPATPVHGDLSPDQVIHGPDGVALIDLDRSGTGSPAADLASWVAAQLAADPLHEDGLRLPPALLDGYLGVGGPATAEDVARHLPTQILRRLSDPFRSRLPDWPQRVEALVRHAEVAASVGASA